MIKRMIAKLFKIKTFEAEFNQCSIDLSNKETALHRVERQLEVVVMARNEYRDKNYELRKKAYGRAVNHVDLMNEMSKAFSEEFGGIVVEGKRDAEIITNLLPGENSTQIDIDLRKAD